MKQFNLKEYKKNPNRRVITRDGRSVRIVCTDIMGAFRPVLAVYKKDPTHEVWNSYTTDGKFCINGDSQDDLFFAPEKKEGWVNVYKYGGDHYIGDREFYSSESEAASHVWKKYDFIKTVKIEWEE